MSNITDVTQIPGFNKQQYDALIRQAKSQKVDVGLVTASLLEAVNSGKNFDEAMQQVTAGLPKLVPPNVALMDNLANWPAMPAPGAIIMALITEVAADQRQQNRELMWAQTEAVVDSMKDQADKMRAMAVTQMVIGLAAAATTMAAGIAQAKVASAKSSGPGASMIQSAKAQGVGQAVGGGAGALNSVNQFVGSMFQAEFKEMEADQERMRATRDSIKDLNDGLKELIQKSLASAESIQQGKNQATTRILA
jgi:hypothetical protein